MFHLRGRRYLWTLAVALVAAVGLQPAPPVRADDPQAELQAAQDRQKEVAAGLAGAQDALSKVYWEKEDVKNKLNMAESDLTQATSRYAVLEAQRKAEQVELDRLDANLKDTEARFSTRKGQFNLRLRAIQERGRVSYLGVLFGSNSYGDFLTRMDMLKTVVQHDSELMADMRTEMKDLNDQRAVVSARKASVQQLQGQAQAQAAAAETKRAEYKQLNDQLSVKQRDLQAQVAEWERKNAEVEQQIWEIQLRQNRAAGKFAPVEPLKGKPIITDPFGWRIHPIFGDRRIHTGTDFDARMGTPVYAIEDGIVIYEGYDSSYGNRIVIDHGGGISSWYGHLSAFTVSKGDAVKQGDQIGKAGSTGLSTGPHVHLEIRVNNVPQDPMSYFKR
jgi:murein DD-endopeptidase MepM/ murein hydrolase activator NlpD